MLRVSQRVPRERPVYAKNCFAVMLLVWCSHFLGGGGVFPVNGGIRNGAMEDIKTLERRKRNYGKTWAVLALFYLFLRAVHSSSQPVTEQRHAMSWGFLWPLSLCTELEGCNHLLHTLPRGVSL